MKAGDLWTWLVGPPRDPLAPLTRRRMALIAVLAWVGIGADGLSSANYGPEQSFLALGEHQALALFVVLATGLTVFVIGLGYNQVVELFPSGGGGYKAATRLLSPHAGLVAGVALTVDYVLTIAISVAAGMDAVFSLASAEAQVAKLACEVAVVALLVLVNLRGVKESILVLAPIFVAFLASHALLIVYGVARRGEALADIAVAAGGDAGALADAIGWVAVLALGLRAYAIGAGTYTGIEALSNTVHTLAEPRVHTAKVAMLYTAASLAFTAVGIMLLYLLWQAAPEEGRTLNAVVLRSVLVDLLGDGPAAAAMLWFTLLAAAALLFSAANTGFVGGPATLANMAADYWVPHGLGYLSTRLVTQNGILMMGGAAIGALLATGGEVHILVVLYSVAVFTGFFLAFAGLVAHGFREWARGRAAPFRLALASLAALICAVILTMLVGERFLEGGWLAVLVIAGLSVGGVVMRRHYKLVERKLERAAALFMPKEVEVQAPPPPRRPDPGQPVAAFLIGPSLAAGIHTMLWVERLFPDHFKSYLFISVGEVDAQAYGGAQAVERLQREVGQRIAFYLEFARRRGKAATAYTAFGTDLVAELTRQCERAVADYPTAVFFGTKLIFERDNWLVRLLHNQTAIALQYRLHLAGRQMMILPMQV